MPPVSPETIVYLGPSLDIGGARAVLDANYRPPIRRGDLPSQHDGTIVIIDGEFGQSLAVSPKEILRLLDRGTRVIGAASMGALRAAELETLGMEGYGWVFEAYRSNRIMRDDEVAVTYASGDYATLTVPLVNVRRWLEGLEAAKAVDAPMAAALLGRAARLFFADRTPERLHERWAQLIGQPRLEELLRTTRGVTDIKAADAALALRAARSGCEPRSVNGGGIP